MSTVKASCRVSGSSLRVRATTERWVAGNVTRLDYCTMTGEWNAASYHRVSGPQTSWGLKVLSRLALEGNERAIDAGCGTGRLTAGLMARLPRGRLVAIDRSWNMLL